jgi:hypothetical protein
MDVFTVPYMDGRATEDTDIVEMVEEVRAGLNFMDMAAVVRNGLARYSSKAVIMRIFLKFRQTSASGEFMDVALPSIIISVIFPVFVTTVIVIFFPIVEIAPVHVLPPFNLFYVTSLCP